MKEFNVAILGATGAVGTRMIQQLEQSTIPVKSVVSAGIGAFSRQGITIQGSRCHR
ncbi:hypothetical protein HMPREF9104_02343 [Lentilactobacillus kisonensis F0435]|uniref:Semialdehyde dehydrogenase NAD-binding domain-containing protein n=1 Tax=Lentilactobacillus kisonensis F0435 TaxID=797516 RepID=H1LIA2_9LACO|nr:hypothetical protein HMPREF9104_02343 [Lentilactobacillus kisonensis F0435]